MKKNLLLDGSRMKEQKFYNRFKKIVGIPWEEWIKKDTTSSESGSEWYRDYDKEYLLCGSVYSPPKLYGLTQER